MNSKKEKKMRPNVELMIKMGGPPITGALMWEVVRAVARMYTIIFLALALPMVTIRSVLWLFTGQW